jgi:predicted  nucleic acid-binding Zn-ribbon protein
MTQINDIRTVARGLIKQDTYVYAGDIGDAHLSEVMNSARPYISGMTYNGVKLTRCEDLDCSDHEGLGCLKISYNYRQSLSEGLQRSGGGGATAFRWITGIASLGISEAVNATAFETLSSSVKIFYNKTTGKVATNEAAYQQADRDLENARREAAANARREADQRAAIYERERQAAANAEALQRAQDEIVRLNGEITRLNSEISEFNESIEILRESIKAMGQGNARLVSDLRKQLSQAESKLASKEQQLREITGMRANSQRQVEHGKREQKSLRGSSSDLEALPELVISGLDISSYQYNLSTVENLLHARVNSVDDLIMSRVLEGSNYSEDNYDHDANDIITQLKTVSQYNDHYIMLPVAIENKHAAGLLMVKQSDTNSTYKCYYMDSENNNIPDGLKKIINQSGYELEQLPTEHQKYSNCGPEVIENFLLYTTGERYKQEEAIIRNSKIMSNELLSRDVELINTDVQGTGLSALSNNLSYDSNILPLGDEIYSQTE